jgi:hypothetical protein
MKSSIYWHLLETRCGYAVLKSGKRGKIFCREEGSCASGALICDVCVGTAEARAKTVKSAYPVAKPDTRIFTALYIINIRTICNSMTDDGCWFM